MLLCVIAYLKINFIVYMYNENILAWALRGCALKSRFYYKIKVASL